MTMISTLENESMITDITNQSENNILSTSETLLWGESKGLAICTQWRDQYSVALVSDGTGGVIFAWVDERNSDEDIYAQRVSSDGVVQWTIDGIPICTAIEKQYAPSIVSDGEGGAIIAWGDYRNYNYDIYAQRINANGDIQWTPNGVPVCTVAGNQYIGEKIVSDGTGGAILTWYESTNYDVYAQKIDSNGMILWNVNGTAICTASNSQRYPDLISDGAGGAIIAWQDDRSASYEWDIYAQKIDSNGTTLWNSNGLAISNAADAQFDVSVVSDGGGGAIIAWYDNRFLSPDSYYDIYAQRVDTSGTIRWTTNGVAITTATRAQWLSSMVSDGSGGALLAWHDYRSPITDNLDIYVQKVNSNGVSQWTSNGLAVCTETSYQNYPSIINDGNGGAFVAWTDKRNGESEVYAQQISASGTTQWTTNGRLLANDSSRAQMSVQLLSDDHGGAIVTWLDAHLDGGLYNIYAQKIITHEIPTVNHPSDFLTTTTGTETIGWILTDDLIPGQYRVLANDTSGAIYTWIDWTPWTSGMNLNVPINRIVPGVFAYTIEYRDGCLINGTSDTVVVTVNDPPIVNHPDDIFTTTTGTETIGWILTDDLFPGEYRVLANDTSGAIYTWIDWTPWTSGTNLNVPINRITSGVFEYTIEHRDGYSISGTPDTVVITVNDAPTAVSPGDLITSNIGTETIGWFLTDDLFPGEYRVLANDTSGAIYTWIDWTPWTSGINLNVPINRTALGVFTYTIEYRDGYMVSGIPDTIVVTVNDVPTVLSPGDVITSNIGTETIGWVLMDNHIPGEYRVLANNTSGAIYTWIDWTAWTNGTILNVPINRTAIGVFSYTIEYRDGNMINGIPNTVLITVCNVPMVLSSGDVTTYNIGTETLDWVLMDTLMAGEYRVLANDTNGKIYTWIDWTAWTNGTILNVPINRTIPGIFAYTIEYQNGYMISGIPDTILVTINDVYPGTFWLYSDADNPDLNGNINIYWSNSLRANNYSIYMRYYVNESWKIKEIQGGMIVQEQEVTNLTYGMYFFQVIAFNQYGNRSSNWIDVFVKPDASKDEEVIFSFDIIILCAGISVISIVSFFSIKKRYYTKK
ncbi:MAG: hypothetical protein JW891_01425, partial [Candidatus Lokiarchaeota archaeon]|nr:hypothetical protein [Candidatus Lokiarchaeota archaeon]